MKVIVKLLPGHDSAIANLTTVAAGHGAHLERLLNPGGCDATYLAADVADSYDEAVKLAQILDNQPGVEASYVKPPDSLPTF
jgi:hypothetical protein